MAIVTMPQRPIIRGVMPLRLVTLVMVTHVGRQWVLPPVKMMRRG